MRGDGGIELLRSDDLLWSDHNDLYAAKSDVLQVGWLIDIVWVEVLDRNELRT
jgi:hypothetical protein